jgi:hypothetical protein
MNVIMLDEVDVNFEGHGDKGFWQAVKFLCKRSKCPIVLTANTLPEEVRGIKTEQAKLTPPTLEEATYFVGRVLKAEGMNFTREEVRLQERERRRSGANST